MEGSPIDIVVFAPLAPLLGVLLFWFIQLLFIESQKYFLDKINHKHPAFCRFTNFLGIMFQTICHALGYTITKSGISEFYISVNYGRVAPKKEKKGIFEWVSNVFLFVGPFFIPAFLIIIILYFFIPQGFAIIIPEQIIDLKYTFGGQLTIFGASLFNFVNEFFNFLTSLDLFHPAHFGFLLLLIFFGLGIRPSHIGEKKPHRVDMIYELRNIWDLIYHKPLYVIILLSLAYLIFYISLYLNTSIYVAIFALLGWVSIISIISLFISHMIILFIRTLDEIPSFWKYIPLVVLPLSYILMRVLFFYINVKDYVNSTSLFMMVFSTAILVFVLYRSKSDKFKTIREMKLLKKKTQGDADEQ